MAINTTTKHTEVTMNKITPNGTMHTIPTKSSSVTPTPILDGMINRLIASSSFRPLSIAELNQLKEFQLIKETLKQNEQQ